ncbi:MAG: hypothetical protein K6D38_12345 [Pseudobutyrivibrio sp.]|nr:hypothetical protein [Pseudobutyrivibrio sp.]
MGDIIKDRIKECRRILDDLREYRVTLQANLDESIRVLHMTLEEVNPDVRDMFLAAIDQNRSEEEHTAIREYLDSDFITSDISNWAAIEALPVVLDDQEEYNINELEIKITENKLKQLLEQQGPIDEKNPDYKNNQDPPADQAIPIPGIQGNSRVLYNKQKYDKYNQNAINTSKSKTNLYSGIIENTGLKNKIK